jgi:hypothetical protein
MGLRARRVDRDLAGGLGSGASAELTRRAEQLTSQETRTRLARALEAAVHLAHASPPQLAAPGGIQRHAVRENSKSLLRLAERLREERSVNVQGVAIVRVLTSEGAGRLYWARAPRPLGQVVRSALRAIDLQRGNDLAGGWGTRCAPPRWGWTQSLASGHDPRVAA